MTKTGRTLAEYMDLGSAGIVALCHFVDKLGADSVLVDELSDIKTKEWTTRLMTNAILADLFDAIRQFHYGFAEKGASKPKPYPRPWDERKGKKYGQDPIPIQDFDDWWGSKE